MSDVSSHGIETSWPQVWLECVTHVPGPLRQDSCRLPLDFGPAGRGSDDDVTRPFSLAYKQKMLGRLTGKDAVSARQLVSGDRSPPTNALAVAAGRV